MTMSRPKGIWGVAALAVSLSGCAAHSLSALQAEFNSLATTTHAKCTEPGNANDVALARCLINSGPAFADLARKAADGAGATGTDARIKLALHRLAAMAGWYAGGESLTLAIDQAEAGKAVCRAIGAQQAPRDCALVAIASALVENKRLAVDILALGEDIAKISRASPSDAFCPAYRARVLKTRAKDGAPGLGDVVDPLASRVVRPLQVAVTGIDGRKSLDAGAKAYIVRQRDIAIGNFKKLRALAERCTAGTRVTTGNACDCDGRATPCDDTQAIPTSALLARTLCLFNKMERPG